MSFLLFSKYSLLISAQKNNWDQAEFEKLLLEWMVACDQPFEEVERPEFRRLLEYTHLNSSLNIPSHTTVQRRIMKMGEDTHPCMFYPLFHSLTC